MKEGAKREGIQKPLESGKRQGGRLFPRVSRKEDSLADILETSALQNSKTGNLCVLGHQVCAGS